MRPMSFCPTCQQHHYQDEAACPRCLGVPASRPSEIARRLKMGGLLVFTALTTTACYGAPPPAFIPVGGSIFQGPSEKVPTKSGTAYLYVTRKGESAVQSNLSLETATFDGTKLGFKSSNAARELEVSLEAADATAFAIQAGARAALPLEKLKSFSLSTILSGGSPVNVTLPGKEAITGNLQIDNVTDTTIGGVLTLDMDGVTVRCYFLVDKPKK